MKTAGRIIMVVAIFHVLVHVFFPATIFVELAAVPAVLFWRKACLCVGACGCYFGGLMRDG